LKLIGTQATTAAEGLRQQNRLGERYFAEGERVEADGIPRGGSLDNLDLNDLNLKKSQTFQCCRLSP